MNDSHNGITVDRETCVVCGVVEGLSLVVAQERCRPCGIAALVCPTGALACPGGK
jgi:Pyruvate/2-oxoacid:ferredoxin oxidoreductase delta subunit